MDLRHYETVFIVTPVLSDQQMKETVEKVQGILEQLGAEIYHSENWGLKKLAYPINKKTTGVYQLFEFKATPEAIAQLEIEYKRDERVMRFLTVALDKYAVQYNEKRRSNKKQPKEEVAS